MKRFSRFMKRDLPTWTPPIALFGLALVAFVPLLPRLGFYWDDWAQLFSYRVSGAAGFWAYFAWDRPLSAWTSALFSPLLGASSIGWHVFTLGLRCLSTVAFWWLLREIWPERSWIAALAALLFLVYPAFSQQSIGVAYHQHWLQYALFLFSLAASARALRQRRRRIQFTLLALTAQVLQLSITEYFVLSELLRPVIFFLIRIQPQMDDPQHVKPGWLSRQHSLARPLKCALLDWLPYLVVLSSYTIWQLFFLRPLSDANRPVLLYKLFQQPGSALIELAHSAVWDILWILVANWARVFNLTLEQINQPFTLAAWGIGLLAGVFFAIYLARLSEPAGNTESATGHFGTGQNETAFNWTLQALLLGGLALLLGPMPVWILGTGNILSDADPYHSDRYALAALLGVALLFATLIDWVAHKRLQKAVLAGVIIGLSVSYQLRTANEYRWQWIEQSRFFQQLAWRAPSLVPGTAVITEDIIFPYQGNFATASALNLLYPQTRWPSQVDYWVYALRPRFDGHSPEQGAVSLSTNMRTSHFNSSTAQGVFALYDTKWQNCLWVLRPIDQSNPYVSDFYKSWLSDSYRTQIKDADVDPTGLPGPGFNTSASVDWCYFYEKSELAIQQGDWLRAAQLGDQAQAVGYQPNQPPTNSTREWLAFIEGYARVGQTDTAHDLTLQSYQNDHKTATLLCTLWQGLKTDRVPGYEQVMTELSCPSQ